MKQLLSTLMFYVMQAVPLLWAVGAGGIILMVWKGRRQDARELLRRYTTAAAILTAAALVVLVEDGFHVVKASTAPPPVLLPAKGFLDSFPMQCAGWQGESQELDAEIFLATQAYDTMSRVYRNAAGNVVKVHFALYENFSTGVYHNPMNCYRSNGWTLKKDAKVPMPIEKPADIPEIEVYVTTWEKQGQQALVLFWYQVEDNVLYERGDILRTRMAMAGKKVWEPTFKVLMETPAGDPAAAQVLIMEMARQARIWISGARRLLNETPSSNG